MLRRVSLILFFSCLAACRFDASGIGADAAPGDTLGPPDAPDDCSNECVAGGTQLCDAEGNVVECPLGCDDAGAEPRCRDIVPSNGASDTDLTDVTAGLTIRSGETGIINTEVGSIHIDGNVIRQPVHGVTGGIGFSHLPPSLAVLAVSSLSVESGGTLRPEGTRALIILSSGDVTIGGLIDISGGCPTTGTPECAGPGGGRGSTGSLPGSLAGGCAPGGNGFGDSGGNETGDGGGGMGAPGAPGGNGSTTMGGTSGAIDGCPGPELEGLQGGSGGGWGGQSGAIGNGGGGGGALQITSMTQIVFMAGGEIWAGGGGGGPGINGANVGNGGGGGGSGGAILLEAPIVTAAGAIVTANGGGGGGGSGTTGTAGEKGTRTTAQAAGGAGGAGGGETYRGGPGGALEGAAGQGKGGGDGTGGGGGGVGIIRINAPADKLDIAGATISPAQTRGDPASQ